MGGKQTEACGRCSVTTVLDATETVDGEDAEAGEDAETGGTNPFDGERIELEERELTAVVRHEVALRRVKDKLDAVATRLTYGA